ADTAVDLEILIAGAGVTQGWKIGSAVGINDDGLLVGYLAPLGAGYQSVARQGFALDLGAAAPQVVPLPNWGDWTMTYARCVNNNGDILGVYKNPDGSFGLYFYNPSDPTTPRYLNHVSNSAYLNNPLLDASGNVIL